VPARLLEPAAGLVIGGKYRLLERIGVGGMSEVYRAENTLIGRIVALKLLTSARADDLDLSARFFQEAQSVSRIRHPGIVDVLDAGQGETGPYMVMEYLEGESAAQVLARQGKLTLGAALETVLPVLDALAAAHAAGVVHRDLKPENVFYAVDDEGQVAVKLLDFGVAKMLWPSGPSPRTSTGVVMGTPDYLSPEQANGDHDVDGRSDLFSVGVLLFELLTNRRPFHAPTAVATAYKVAHARTPRVAEHGGPGDPTIDAILQRAMKKRREERYASAAELAHELSPLTPSHSRGSLRELVQVRQSGYRRVEEHTPTPRRPSSGRALVRSTPSRDEVEPWQPSSAPRPSSGLRSLPPRFVGQCHARGLVLRAVDEYVAGTATAEQRQRVLDELGPEHARDFTYGTLQAIVYYDLECITRYLELSTRTIFGDNPNWCRAAGDAAVSGELSPIVRPALRPDRALGVLKRITPLTSRWFDFGVWDASQENERLVSLRITDFEAASLQLRLWLVGVIEGALRAAGPGCQLAIARGEAAFAPQLVLDISTR
jgi:serine/threonine-protein kinase